MELWYNIDMIQYTLDYNLYAFILIDESAKEESNVTREQAQEMQYWKSVHCTNAAKKALQ